MSIDELKAGFTRLAESVVPDEDPYGRLLRRSRRRRRARFAGICTAVVSLLAAALVGPGVLGYGGLSDRLDERPVGTGYPIDSEWTRRLINSPTRGNLAGDKALIFDLTRAFDRSRDEIHMASSLPKVKVLFAHDSAEARLVLVAYYSDSAAGLVSRTARHGASANTLINASGAGNLRLEPFTRMAEAVQQDGQWSARGLLGLAPAGCTVESSRSATIGADGTVRRTWQPSPTGDYLLRETDNPDELWQVTCDNVVRYRGPARVHVEEFGGWPATEFPQIPARLRGKVDYAAATAAMASYRHLVGSAGLAADEPVVLWGREATGKQDVAAVLVGPSEGSGPIVLHLGPNPDAMVALDSVDDATPDDTETKAASRTDWSLVSTAVVTSTDLVAVRVPKRAGGHAVISDDLLIVGPAKAVKVEAARADGTIVRSASLVNGVGQIALPIGAKVTLRVLDAAGKTIASTSLREPANSQRLFGEELVSNW